MSAAESIVSTVESGVNAKLAQAVGWADSARTAASDIIKGAEKSNVLELKFTIPEPKAPTDMPEPVVPAVGANKPLEKPSPSRGQISTAPSMVGYSPVTVPSPIYATPLDVPDRSSEALAAPDLAYPMVYDQPAPTSSDVAPTAPVLSRPEKPLLTPPSIPAYTFPTLRQFSQELPDVVIPDSIDMPAPVAVAFDIERWRTLIESATGDLNDEWREVCRRMADELVSGIDRESAQKRDELYQRFASANYSIPPGTLLGELNDLSEEAGRRIREEHAKIQQRIFETAFDRFKSAAGQAIRAEKVLLEIHTEQIRQHFEVQKLSLKAHWIIYNTLAETFNAKQTLRAAHAEAYGDYLQGRLRELEVHKGIVEGELAKAKYNEAVLKISNNDNAFLTAKVQVYNAEVEAFTAEVNKYRASVTEHEVSAKNQIANFGVYKEAIKGYSTFLQGASAEVGAYRAQVTAASSVVDVHSTNGKAYAAYLSEIAKIGQASKSYVSSQTEVFRTYLSAFSAAAKTDESYIRAFAQHAESQAQVINAQYSDFSNLIGLYSSSNQAKLAYKQAMDNYNLLVQESNVLTKSIASTIASENDKIEANYLTAKAGALASLAQGAMSAMSVRASAEGGAAARMSAGLDYRFGRSMSYSDTVSESHEEIISV